MADIPESKPKRIRKRRGDLPIDASLNPTNSMLCMTVRQPWAWALFALGPDGRALKRYENRLIPPRLGSERTILIHAGASPYIDGEARALLPEMTMGVERTLPYGSIVGVIDVVGFHNVDDLPPGTRLAHGPVCMEMANPRAFRRPIPFRGRIHPFRVPHAVVEEAIATAAGLPIGPEMLPGWIAGICHPMKLAIDVLEIAEDVSGVLEPLAKHAKNHLRAAVETCEIYAATQQAIDTPTFQTLMIALRAVRTHCGAGSLTLEAVEFEILETISGLISGDDVEDGLVKLRGLFSALRDRSRTAMLSVAQLQVMQQTRGVPRYSTMSAVESPPTGTVAPPPCD